MVALGAVVVDVYLTAETVPVSYNESDVVDGHHWICCRPRNGPRPPLSVDPGVGVAASWLVNGDLPQHLHRAAGAARG
jgi:hypothetical protein